MKRALTFSSLMIISIMSVTSVSNAQFQQPTVYRPYLSEVCDAAEELKDLRTRYTEVANLMNELSEFCEFDWLPAKAKCQEGMCTYNEDRYRFRAYRGRRSVYCPPGKQIVDVECAHSLPYSCSWSCETVGQTPSFVY